MLHHLRSHTFKRSYRMDKQYTCLLCQQPGERLVASGYLPNLFVLQEHLVKDHGVPWEYVLLSSTLPGGVGQDGEVIEWCLPPEKAAACDLRRSATCASCREHMLRRPLSTS